MSHKFYSNRYLGGILGMRAVAEDEVNCFVIGVLGGSTGALEG